MRIPISIAIIILVLSSQARAAEGLPFWRLKPKLMKQIKEDRRIVVSVKRQDGDGASSSVGFRILAAGVVNVPLRRAFQDFLKFEKLKEVSSYFQVVRHTPEKREVYLKMVALGYAASMLVRYQVSVMEDGQQRLEWTVGSGSFRGMVGHYTFRRLGARKTEISLWAQFQGSKLPLPPIFVSFTLEVIAEKIAQRMRTFLEGSYRGT